MAATDRPSRRTFLNTSARELAWIEGDTVRVAPRPSGLSEKAYYEHLDTATMTVRAREAQTRDLPERLWGGVAAAGMDPISAEAVAASYRKKGWIVSITWDADTEEQES